MSDTEVKEYLITPVKNRFVPDIVKNGRIEYPERHKLNAREVRRVRSYGYLVEQISGPDPPLGGSLCKLGIGKNKIGHAYIA